MKITRDTNVKIIVETYPEIAKYLQIEWEFHCVSCILNGFDTLESAAEIHELSEEDLDLLLVIVNEMTENIDRNEVEKNSSSLKNSEETESEVKISKELK